MDNLQASSALQIQLPMEEIADFCRRWHILELALFGSVLREDFRPDSDIDVLVSFGIEAPQSLADWIVMQEQIETILGRKVDLISRQGIQQSRNYIRRKAILDSARIIYILDIFQGNNNHPFLF